MFWARGSAGVATLCPTDAEPAVPKQPHSWRSWAARLWGDHSGAQCRRPGLPRQLLSTSLNRAAQDPSPSRLPDQELAVDCLPVPLAHTPGQRDGLQMEKDSKILVRGLVWLWKVFPIPWCPDPSLASSIRLRDGDGTGPWNPSFGSFLGKPEQNKGAGIFIRCNPKSCRASDWVRGEPTKFHAWFWPLVSHPTTDKSLIFSQSWFPNV